MKKTDLSIKIAIAGTVVATAMAAEATGVPIKVTPECFRVLDDTRKFGELFKRSGKVKANPLWLEDGLFKGDADAASPATIDYLRSRRLKKVGSTAVGIGAILSSAHTAGISVPGAAKEGNASASTLAHIGKLRSIGGQHERVPEIQGWIRSIVGIKSVKLSFRTTKFIGSFLPAASIPISIVTEFSRLGVDMTIEALCDTLAAEIHHAAFLELMHKGGEGPASQIVRELFTRRGATAVFGRYDPSRYIREPGGWKAIADKLSMS